MCTKSCRSLSSRCAAANGSLSGSAGSLPKSESDGGDQQQFASSGQAPQQAASRMIQSYSAPYPSSQPTVSDNGRTQPLQQTTHEENDDLDSFKMPDMSISVSARDVVQPVEAKLLVSYCQVAMMQN